MELTDLGFSAVGGWRLDASLKSGVRANLSALQGDRVIYAFVADGTVRYIGVCDNSSTTLRDRMKRYQHMLGAGTNKRVVGRIKALLEAGRSVAILAWKPASRFTKAGLVVDLVKGLENPLIDAFKPEWNIRS